MKNDSQRDQCECSCEKCSLKFEIESAKTALKTIFKIINNLNYECEAGIYTLDDHEMGNILFCRDLAEIALMELNLLEKKCLEKKPIEQSKSNEK